MKELSVRTMRLLVAGTYSGEESPRELLLPVHAQALPLQLYAEALVKYKLAEEAKTQLESLCSSRKNSFGWVARASLLSLYLDQIEQDLEQDDTRTSQRAILDSLYRSSPYFQPAAPLVRSELRPTRVEVTSPLRIDLAMGGLSDLPPWTNEQPGKAVSLCATVNSEPAMKCVAEVTACRGVTLESVDRGTVEIISNWSETEDTNAPTAIARACLAHLFPLSSRNESLQEFIASLFGGGLKLQTTSRAPKGLGSSSILASVLLQAIFRLLGHRIDWEELIHRTVAVERLMAVGGGWEDALPPFFGGVVLAESTPSRLPVISARKLSVTAETLNGLQDRLVLFDTEISGSTAEVLAEGTLRYLSGEEATKKACFDLLGLSDEVAHVAQSGDIERLGGLLSAQWDAWKLVTGNRCTNERIDRILSGSAPWVTGAKANGAGSGGAVEFITKKGCRNDLLEYLKGFPGQVIAWEPDTAGYEVREWYDPGRVANFMRTALSEQIRAQSSYERHGEIVELHVQEYEEASTMVPLVGPLNPAIFDLISDLPLTVLATAAGLVEHIGAANQETLSSTKRLIDAVASGIFADEMHHWQSAALVGTSEGKDEHGAVQPAIRPSHPVLMRRTELRTAVDVVDGTTTAAIGLPGAYSICAVGEGLLSFPDLQAYAILSPTSAFENLDIRSSPEIALEQNLRAIANSVGKAVNQLTIVTHSEDTGLQHNELIRAMKQFGVSVIVPAPVIVEPPYVVAACTGCPIDIDGIIGVFGLPEIAINTVLCGTLNRGKNFIFRLASNTPLKNRDQTNLDGIFDFSADEKQAAFAARVRLDELYTFEKITSGQGCLFAAAAITDDPVLGFRGVRKLGDEVIAEGWFTEPCGTVYSLRARFRRPSDIDFTARYPVSLFDISLLADLHTAESSTGILARIEKLATQIRRMTPGIYAPSFHPSPEGDPGLHVTLFEFLVDDGLLASIKLLNIVDKADTRRSEREKVRLPLSILIDELPKRFTSDEIRLPCSDDRKFEIVEQVRAEAKKRFAGRILPILDQEVVDSVKTQSIDSGLVEVDGVRVQFVDESFFLVRASNTSPMLTFRFEGKTRNILAERCRDAFDLLSPFQESVADLEHLIQQSGLM